MQKNRSGFTLVEVLVVIVVISILAGIGIVSYTRVQINTRDTTRSSRTNIIAAGLEKYYEQNGEYPSCTDMKKSGADIKSTVLKGIDTDVLVTPKSDAGSTNSITCTELVEGSGADSYAYVGDGSPTCSTGVSCLQFTLQYREEGTGKIISIPSKRKVTAASAMTTVLTVKKVNAASVDLQWDPVASATSYMLQRATNSAFSSGLTSVSTSATTLTSSGLSIGNTYYFRVAATVGGVQGAWSNITSAAFAIGVPSLTATQAGSTQINLGWTAVTDATGYQLQRATNAGFSTGLATSTVSGTSLSVTGLAPETTYYFRIAGLASGNQGDWSNVASATTIISPPSTPTATAGMSGTTAVGTANVATCAYGTTQYQLRYRSQNTGTLGAWSAFTSWSSSQRTYNVAAIEGSRYDFETYARCQGSTTTSTTTYGGIASTVRGINTPGAPTYLMPSQFWSNGDAWVNYATYCPGGTWMVNGTFHSRDWLGGNWGPYAFPFLDAWENTDGVDRYIEYWGSYQCQTSYAASPFSPESYNVIVVHS